MTFVLQTVLYQGGDWSGDQKFYLKRGRSVTSVMGEGGGHPGTFFLGGHRGTLLGLGNVDCTS